MMPTTTATMRQLFYIFICLTPVVTRAWDVGLPSQAVLGDPSDGDSEAVTYDYVVVGGGNAGLVIAERLSEDPKKEVAVVEAGNFYEIVHPDSQAPGNDFMYNGKNPNNTDPRVDWGFLTTKQPGVDNVAVHFARGKTFGGCTALNYMAYQRTTVGALQQWADVVGDQSWTYDNVSSYYLKSLNFTPPDMSKRMANATPKWDSETMAQGGPLDLTYSNQASAFSTWAAKAFEYLGMAPIHGFTGGKLFGSGWLVSTINQTTGFRESSEAAFLAPYVKRKNLHLYNNTLAEKILFDGKKAEGVRVNDTKNSFPLKAREEVIVSAGAIQSPQLLQVSGVGPAELLKEHDIPVVADRQGVGRNLIDHVFFGIDWPVKVETASVLANDEDHTALKEAIEQFKVNQTGLLASPGGEFAAYQDVPPCMRSQLSSSSLKELSTLPKDWPELQFFPLPTYVGDFDWPGTQDPADGRMYATILATLIAPMSRGNVSLQSSSMQDHPLINPNWLTSQTDIEVAIAGFKRLRQIFATPALSNITDNQEEYPGPHVQSDYEIHKAIQKSFQSMYHPSSTCKMGRRDDTSAVVDSKGQVIGVENLRIADASVFPFLPPGLPMGTIYMTAEKIADDIKKAGES